MEALEVLRSLDPKSVEWLIKPAPMLETLETLLRSFKQHQVIQEVYNKIMGFPDGGKSDLPKKKFKYCLVIFLTSD